MALKTASCGIFYRASCQLCILQGRLPQDLPYSTRRAMNPSPARGRRTPGRLRWRRSPRNLARLRRLPAAARARLGLEGALSPFAKSPLLLLSPSFRYPAGLFALQALVLEARIGSFVLTAQNPAFKSRLGALVLRRKQKKSEIESPVGGPSAKRRLLFVCISAQVFKSYTLGPAVYSFTTLDLERKKSWRS